MNNRLAVVEYLMERVFEFWHVWCKLCTLNSSLWIMDNVYKYMYLEHPAKSIHIVCIMCSRILNSIKWPTVVIRKVMGKPCIFEAYLCGSLYSTLKKSF